MTRAQRLLQLIQIFRAHRFPVSGAYLAEELGISLRTLYRDIKTLQEQGAHIEGEPGVGYVLCAGFMLPPLMFTKEETEALVLGSLYVVDRGDDELVSAAQSALAKITAVLPKDMLHVAQSSTLIIVPSKVKPPLTRELPTIRKTIRAEYKAQIAYTDLKEQTSSRTIWPFALGYFDQAHILVAWCELRGQIRHFRTDRIQSFTPLEQRYPQRRQALLKQWRAEQAAERATECEFPQHPPT